MRSRILSRVNRRRNLDSGLGSLLRIPIPIPIPIHSPVSLIYLGPVDSRLQVACGRCAAERDAAPASASGAAAAARVRIVMLAVGEEAREELGDEGPGSGETGADDGDVAFDRGPAGGADVVVWLRG
jgi:hypothetical protein